MNKKAFLFPAFVLKYTGQEVELLTTNNIDFHERLYSLSEISGVDLRNFDIEKNNYIDDELKNQLLTYLISCLYSDVLKSKSIHPQYISALSMGLYAALYAAGSIAFYDGVLLIKRIYELLLYQTGDKQYKMLAITGLSDKDIAEILDKECLNCEVVIKNNNLSYILTGEQEHIVKLFDTAQKEGAMHLNLFPVSVPYHSKFINTEGFEEIIFRDISVNLPGCKVFSSINRKVLSTHEEIKAEIISNLAQPVDWYKTMKILISKGVCDFAECGPGDSLKRMSRFIEDKHKVYSLSKII